MNDIKHVAIIMDGNARWAKEKGLAKTEGHKNGAEAIRKLLPAAAELGINYLTLYTFSTENWRRPVQETEFLLRLFESYLSKEIDSLNKNGIRLKIIGDFSRFSQKLQNRIDNSIKVTENNNKITLCLAFSYGGRTEIVNACQKVINSGKLTINEEELGKYLYDEEMPDVDLLIRTGGIYRVSNFLLWQIAYAEMFFTKKYWPDFTKDDLIEALDDYSRRKRNFGAR